MKKTDFYKIGYISLPNDERLKWIDRMLDSTYDVNRLYNFISDLANQHPGIKYDLSYLDLKMAIRKK